MTTEGESSARELFLRGIAVLGLIAILLLGAWGIIQLAVHLPGFFNSIAGWRPAQKETLTVASPAIVTSGAKFDINWKHQNGSGEYSYSISYACQPGLTVKAPTPSGTYTSVECNTPFNYTNSNTTTKLQATADGSQVPITVTVSANKLSTGAITVSSAATTNVQPSAPSTSTTKPKTTTTTKKTTTTTSYKGSGRTTNLFGLPDLAIYINSITPDAYGRNTVKFTIENIGTNLVLQGWMFNATLPIQGSYSFSSQPQQALYPGDKIVYTLTYDAGSNYSTYNLPAQTGYNGYSVPQPYQYSYNGQNLGGATIQVDANNYVPELNENNNFANTNSYGSYGTYPGPVYY